MDVSTIGAAAVVGAVVRLGSKGLTARQVALHLNSQDRVREVRDELDQLVCDARGTYALGEEGEVVYDFPPNLRSRLYKRRVLLYVQEEVAPRALRVLKTLVGSFVIVSVCIGMTVVLLLVLVNSEHRGGHSPPILLWGNPWRGGFHRVEDGDAQDGGARRPGGFVSDVLHFIFGPRRARSEDAEWALVRRVIAQHKFSVSAAQLRPFVHDAMDSSDAFMGRICRGLGGRAEASADGQSISFRFDELQAAEDADAGSEHASATYLREAKWVFRERSVSLPLLLGVVNVVLLAVLLPYVRAVYASHDNGGVILWPYPASSRHRLRGVGVHGSAAREAVDPFMGLVLTLVSWLYPLMAVYGTLYLLIPALRYVACIGFLNRRIDARNKFRASLVARKLGSGTTPEEVALA